MWLNPLKGDHLTLRQLDKTLPVNLDDASAIKIKRGIFVYISTNSQNLATGANEPRFALYTSAAAKKPNAVPYIALQDLADTQASMAGNDVQAPSVSGNLVDGYGVKAGDAPNAACPDRSGTNEQAFLNPVSPIENAQHIRGPRITAVSILSPAEWQTDAFDRSQAEANYYVGCPLTINDDGMLTPFPEAGGVNIVGYVTQPPTMRWVNNLGASENGARISGGNRKCLAFSTAWIPVAAVASGDDKNVGPMSKGKPEVKAAAAAPTAPKAPEAPKAQNTPAK